MILLDLPRRRGKTTTLIHWAKQASWTRNQKPTRVIVVADIQRAHLLRQEFEGEKGVHVFTASEAMTKVRGLSHVEIGIDELDDVLGVIFGAPVVVATRTGEQHGNRA